MSEFNNKLKYYRKQARLTQEQMAEKLDITPNQYQNYEQGRSYPYVERLISICKVFNIPMDYLFSDNDRIFQDYASAFMFKRLSELDDTESKSIFNLLQKLLELKNMTDEPEE